MTQRESVLSGAVLPLVISVAELDIQILLICTELTFVDGLVMMLFLVIIKEVHFAPSAVYASYARSVVVSNIQMSLQGSFVVVIKLRGKHLQILLAKRAVHVRRTSACFAVSYQKTIHCLQVTRVLHQLVILGPE